MQPPSRAEVGRGVKAFALGAVLGGVMVLLGRRRA
jgi:hypothetical protein